MILNFKGILGGTSAIAKVKLLNSHLAYITFDDGHAQGYAVFRFTIEDGGIIKWQNIIEIMDGEQ